MGYRLEGHGAMVRVWPFADVAACRAVSNPDWCRIFKEISCPPQSCFDGVPLGKALHPQMLNLIQVKMSRPTRRTEMAMRTISLMGWNGCRIVCSPWSRNDTKMNRSSNQGVNVKSDDRSPDLISDYKPKYSLNEMPIQNMFSIHSNLKC